MTDVALILAAGRGERLGGVAKALLTSGDRTFLQTVAATAADAGIASLLVVVAEPYGAAVAAHAAEGEHAVVWNPAPERGMASSIAIGFATLLQRQPAAVAPDRSGCWLWPVDHAWVQASTLRALRAVAIADATCEVVIPTYAGDVHARGGHPIWIARSAWPAMVGCVDHPHGARSVIAALRTRRVMCDDSGVLRDCDQPEDLERGHA